PSIIIANAGKARINGLEAEMQIRPAYGLQIDMSASYTDFKIRDLGPAAGVSGGPTLTSKPSGTPEWKYNAGIQYEADLGNAGTLTPRLDVYYQSKVFNEWTNNPGAMQPGYAVANGRLTYSAPEDEWYAALSVTNIFDKF